MFSTKEKRTPFGVLFRTFQSKGCAFLLPCLRCPKFIASRRLQNFDRCALSDSFFPPPAAVVLQARAYGPRFQIFSFFSAK
jgi:hypothetical protein